MKTQIVLIIILFSSWKTVAQVDPIDQNNVAIGGYDLVSYFLSGTATKGNEGLKVNRNGTIYLFSSQENQKLFEDTPQKFIPQYEGYCALAVSYGKKISIDPETFKITDGKLYLFFHGKSGGRSINSIDTWNKSEERLRKKADQLWPNVIKKEYKSGSTL